MDGHDAHGVGSRRHPNAAASALAVPHFKEGRHARTTGWAGCHFPGQLQNPLSIRCEFSRPTQRTEDVTNEGHDRRRTHFHQFELGANVGEHRSHSDFVAMSLARSVPLDFNMFFEELRFVDAAGMKGCV